MVPLHNYTVLIVDDEHLVADTLAAIFCGAGYSIRAAYSAEDVMHSALPCSPHLAILDVFLPGLNGIELARWLKQVCPECHILLLSGQAATADLLDVEERAGYHWTALPKPYPPNELLGMASALLHPESTQARA